MKRPITSPWSAVFTSSATITLMPSAGARAPRARPRPRCGRSPRSRPARAALAVVEQHVDRGRAVGRVVGVHVEVDVDVVARLAALSDRRPCRRRAGARRSPGRAPRTRRRRRSSRARSRSATARSWKRRRSGSSSISRVELRGERVHVLRARTAGPARRPLAPRRTRAGEWPPAPRPWRARAAPAPARADAPLDAATATSAVATYWASRPVGGAHEANAVAQPARQRHRRLGRRWRATTPSPARAASAAARRSARRNMRSAPRSSSAEKKMSTSSPPLGALALHQVHAGADHAVLAGEEALHQVARGRVAHGAPVEAAEEQLHHPARHLRGEDPLGGRVEACPRSASASGAARRPRRSARTARARARSRGRSG